MCMPAARIGDRFVHGNCLGFLIQGSENVWTENIPQSRLTDKGICKCHGTVTVAKASQTVLVNNLGAARIGDKMTCGGIIISGAMTVLMGG